MISIPTLPDLIRNKTYLFPTNVFEIGSYNGDDADFLRKEFEIDNLSNINCFEPDPNNFTELMRRYPFYSNHNIAISNFTGRQKFQCFPRASAISSLRKRVDWPENYPHTDIEGTSYYEYEVEVFRMDDFINIHNIKEIDICKIDVEGCSYEVLEGFGSLIGIVGVFHIEGELKELYKGQKLFADFKELLINNGFTILEYVEFDNGSQCDSVWVNNNLLK